MRIDRFTIKSQEAIEAAQRLAASNHNPETTDAHLLLVMLEQEGSIVDPVLRKVGADPETLRRIANEAVADAPTISGEAQEPVPSKSLIDALRRAEDSSTAMGDTYTRTRSPTKTRRRSLRLCASTAKTSPTSPARASSTL